MRIPVGLPCQPGGYLQDDQRLDPNSNPTTSITGWTSSRRQASLLHLQIPIRLPRQPGGPLQDGQHADIRQLNLYGFRTVGPQCRLTVGNLGRPDWHVFRNDCFTASHAACVDPQEAQVHHGGGPEPSAGSPRQCHGPVYGGRVVHSQGNGMPWRDRQWSGAPWIDSDALHSRLASRGHLRAHPAFREGLSEHHRAFRPRTTYAYSVIVHN